MKLCLMTMVLAGIAIAQPKIDSVVNNSSFTPPGLPSYGVAQGSLFAVKGTGLGPTTPPSLPDLSKSDLTTTLSAVSVRITVGGTTVQAPLYYVFAQQIAGVLPSNTPIGTGTVTVTFNGQTSAPAPITVVAAAFGISAGVLNASNSYGFVTPTTAANPGETIILWGTGLGASAGDETKFPFPQVDLKSRANAKVYIGGREVVVAYAGRSQFPAVDQINVVVPQGVSGCNVGVIVQTGNFVSNSSAIAVAPSGRTCSDPATSILSDTELQTLLTKGSLKYGGFTIGKFNVSTPGLSIGGITLPATNSTSDAASGLFLQTTPLVFTGTGNYSVQQNSFGSCSTTQVTFKIGDDLSNLIPKFLDAGVLSLRLPNGTTVTVPKDKLGTYTLSGTNATGAQIPLFIPAAGGSFTLSGTGGADVGPIAGTQITMPPALNWTNMDAINVITKSQGVTVTWSTVNPYNGIVNITGTSSNVIGTTEVVSSSFTCTSPYSAGTFTVPSYVLLTMLPGITTAGGFSIPTGSLTLDLMAPPVRFTATSLDYGVLSAVSSTGKTVSYQ